MTDFEIKIYELNFNRNDAAHELRWKFMYAFVAGSLAFWGLIFSTASRYVIPRPVFLLPALMALFGWCAYHALRQNMRVRGKVMQELEDKAGVRGWQTLRREGGKKETEKLLVVFAHAFWVTMILVSLLLAALVRL